MLDRFVQFESDRPDEAAARLEAMFGSQNAIRSLGAAENFHVSFRSCGFGGAHLLSLSTGSRIRMCFEDPHMVSLGLVVSPGAGLLIRTPTAEGDLDLGVAAVSATGICDLDWGGGVTTLTLAFPRALLAEQAEAYFHATRIGLAADDDLIDLRAPNSSFLAQMTRHVAAVADAKGLPPPAAQTAVQQMLLHAFLEMLLEQAGRAVSERALSQRQSRRVLDGAQDRRGRPVDLSEVAAEAGVSPRAARLELRRLARSRPGGRKLH